MSRRDDILDAAAQLLIQFGFKKTTMDDIARSCGLERASVYYYFKNKEKILEEVVQKEADRQAAILFTAQDREKTAPAKLRALARAHLRAFATSDLIKRVGEDRTNVFHLIPQAFEVLGARRDKFIELVINIIMLGIRTGEFREVDARQVADGIRTLFVGHVMGFFLHEQVTDEAIIAAFDFLVRGIEVQRD